MSTQFAYHAQQLSGLLLQAGGLLNQKLLGHICKVHHQAGQLAVLSNHANS